MTKGLKILFTIGFFMLFQQVVHAQVNPPRYLQKVGIVDSLYSQILNEVRYIYVQHPDDYHPENAKYPVAYILDGETFLPTLHDVQRYYSGGYTPGMIMIGISNANNRTRDLTVSRVTHKYGMPFKEESGGADDFMRFLEEELIPFVEDKYSATNYRTLIGHSYGGLFAIHALLNKPGLFANYLAIDPSLDWDGQKILAEAKEQLLNNSYVGKSLFVSLSGQLHMQNYQITIDNVRQDTTDFTLFPRSIISFADIVSQNEGNGLAFTWKFYPRDLHGTIPFPSVMDGMLSLFEWYQMEDTDRINSFDTSKEELLGIIEHREEKLKKHFGYAVPPYPEALLNMSGYMNMEMQKSEKAKMYFELAIKFYPDSPNAYDSMADYYEAQNDIGTAITYVQKAAELSSDEYYRNRVRALKNK